MPTLTELIEPLTTAMMFHQYYVQWETDDQLLQPAPV